MLENFEYSKKQYQEKHVIHAKRKERRELAAALLVIGVLVLGYLNQHVFQWW